MDRCSMDREFEERPASNLKRRKRPGGVIDDDSDSDEEERAENVRAKVRRKEDTGHTVQRTKTRGKTVAQKDLEAIAPPKPDNEDDGLWRPSDDFDFLIRIPGSKTLSECLKATLVNMSQACTFVVRKGPKFSGIVVHAQDLAQGPTVVVRARVQCTVEKADAAAASDLTVTCSSRALQEMVRRASTKGGSMILYKFSSEELLRVHSGGDDLCDVEWDAAISLMVSEGGIPKIPPISNEVSISAPTKIVAEMFSNAISDSKHGDGTADSARVLVNMAYEQYTDKIEDGDDICVGRMVLSFDMGSSIQAVSMAICYSKTASGSYHVVSGHPVDEERFEVKFSHNIRAPVVSPMLSALGSRSRLKISASGADQKVVLRCETSNNASVTMIVGTTKDGDDDE